MEERGGRGRRQSERAACLFPALAAPLIPLPTPAPDRRAAVGMLFAFTWEEYQIGGYAKGMTWQAFSHAVSISDVWSDIMHQFNPSYGTYVLHTDGGPEKNVKKKIFQGGAKKARGQQKESAYSQVREEAGPGRARGAASIVCACIKEGSRSCACVGGCVLPPPRPDRLPGSSRVRSPLVCSPRAPGLVGCVAADAPEEVCQVRAWAQ